MRAKSVVQTGHKTESCPDGGVIHQSDLETLQLHCGQCCLVIYLFRGLVQTVNGVGIPELQTYCLRIVTCLRGHRHRYQRHDTYNSFHILKISLSVLGFRY